MPDSRPDPHTLWQQANGDRVEYLRLMREHGRIVPGKRLPGEDIFGHATCPDCGDPTSTHGAGYHGCFIVRLARYCGCRRTFSASQPPEPGR